MRSQSGTGSGVALTVTPSNISPHGATTLPRSPVANAFGSPPPASHDSSVSVVSYLILLATTTQLTLVLMCWGDMGSHWSAAARICRKAGGRVTTNMFMRDMDVAVPNVLMAGASRLWRTGFLCSIALSWTLRSVSPLHANGSPHRRCSHGWRSPHHSTTEEGTYIPRTRGSREQSTVGRRGNRRQMRRWLSCACWLG